MYSLGRATDQHSEHAAAWLVSGLWPILTVSQFQGHKVRSGVKIRWALGAMAL